MLAKIFISIVRLSPGFQKAMWKWWYQRLAQRGHATGWSFMNYGYTHSNGTHLELKKEENGDDLIIAYKMTEIHEAVVFFNKQRRVDDQKKLKVPEKTAKFLIKVLKQLDTATVDSKGKAKANLSIILEGFKNQKVPIHIDDFTAAVDAGFAEEIMFEKGSEMFSVINVPYLESVLPSVMLRNAFDKVNREKADEG